MSAYQATYPMDTVPCGKIESRLEERTGPISELDDIDGLVSTYRARLLRFVTYSTGDLDLAESVVQDTLLKAHENRAKFRGECSVSTWLTGIAINIARSHLRRGRYKFWKRVSASAVDVQEFASFLPSAGISPEGHQLAREKVRQLTQILETLSHNQRTIFLMKFSEEMSVNEIGEALEMNLATVRTHLHRALKAVRSRLGDQI